MFSRTIAVVRERDKIVLKNFFKKTKQTIQMSNPVFNDLRIKLTESIKAFPYVYMFKFIIKADNKTGKLIAYLVSDFIKGVNEK